MTDDVSNRFPLQVLIVDNRVELVQREITRCQEKFGDRVKVHRAHAVDEARVLISSEFFHVAFVDLRLGNSFENGRDLLFRLAKESPTTRRYAMSKYANDPSASVLSLVRPPSQLAHGFIRKEPARSLVAETVEELLAERSRGIPVENHDVLVARLRSEAKRLGLQGVSEEGLANEVFDLIGRVIGFVEIEGLAGASKIQLAPMTQGLSASVLVDALVVLGLDHNSNPVEGNHAVIKFGPTTSIVEEVRRFQEVVTHGVQLSARVELVGHAIGPRLGCVCYSFAGGTPDAAHRLDDWIDLYGKGKLTAPVARRVDAVLQDLFALESRNWYAVDAGRHPVDDFFEKELRTRFMDRVVTVRGWAEKVAEQNRWTVRGRDLILGDLRLRIPDEEFFGGFSLGKDCQFALVHGDMHGGNVLVTRDGTPALIDFAQCGPGPLAIDAAVLQGTIRLWDARTVPSDPRAAARWLGGRVQREEGLARRILQGRTTGRAQVGPWELLGRSLDDLLRANYRVAETAWPDIAPEVLVVYCLQAARLLSLDLGDRGRLRILCWFSAVAPMIERWER